MTTRENLRMAALMGLIARHASRQAGDRAAAVAEIRAAATGRGDLLGRPPAPTRRPWPT